MLKFTCVNIFWGISDFFKNSIASSCKTIPLLSASTFWKRSKYVFFSNTLSCDCQSAVYYIVNNNDSIYRCHKIYRSPYFIILVLIRKQKEDYTGKRPPDNAQIKENITRFFLFQLQWVSQSFCLIFLSMQKTYPILNNVHDVAKCTYWCL
jgi:hypothetical protein